MSGPRGAARQAVMRDPALVPESGRTYERAGIEAWLARSMCACLWRTP